MSEYDQTEILLVEDNSHEAELTLLAIKKSNLTKFVHRVNDGEEAVDFLFGQGKYAGRNINRQPKIILLDLKMPKFDGWQVLEKIKENRYTKAINVIILTSSGLKEDIYKGIKGDVSGYLIKPTNFDEFVKKIYVELGFYWGLFE